MKIAQPSGYWKCAPFWERLTTRLFLPRPESATQLHLATFLSSPHLSSRYLDTRRDALCWVTQEVGMWLTQLAAPGESVCVCPAQQPSQLWRHSQCWGVDPHLQVRGPTLGRPLHQMLPLLPCGRQVSLRTDGWETQTIGMGNINELSRAGLRKGDWLERGTRELSGLMEKWWAKLSYHKCVEEPPELIRHTSFV